jgi:HK97 family phage portal protein
MSSTAGQTVTDQSAMQLMAVWRCRHLIADMVSGCPIDEFVRDGDERHPVPSSPFVLDPAEHVDANDWRYQLVFSAASCGNGFAYGTQYDDRGFVVKAETVPVSEVSVTQKGGFLAPPVYKLGGKVVDTDRVLHLRAFGPMPGSVMGLNPIEYARATIGLGLAVREFGADWYETGGHPTTALVTDGPLEDGDALRAKEKFREATTNDHIVALGNGWKLESVQVNPDDALFLAATNATGVDICGFYGIPPSLLGYAPPAGGTLTYQNGEQRMLDLLTMTLQWWFSRLERAITRQLQPGRYVKCNIDGLLRSDAVTRWKIHDLAVRLGARNLDEVREKEDTAPLPDGVGAKFLWPPAGVTAGEAALDDAESARQIAELIQKVYLGVGVVITAEEARLLINQAGGALGPTMEAQ